MTIVREVLVPEALPGIVAGFTVTLVTLVGASAMAGAIGAGGLGDLAIRYGYQRFETGVMIAVVAVLIVLVSGRKIADEGKEGFFGIQLHMRANSRRIEKRG